MVRWRNVCPSGWSALLLTGTIGSGCYSGVETPPQTSSSPPSDDEGGGTTGPDDDSPPEVACAQLEVGPSVIRRLTRLEYDNTVADLLGTTQWLAREFPADEKLHGFDNAAEAGAVSDLLAEQYMVAAESLAAEATTKLGTLLPCVPYPDADECAQDFITTFGRRAYRRPLTAEQIDRLMAVYQAGAADADFVTGIGLVIETMLQSPHFLYRVEVESGDGASVRPLDDWELASRLSYLLWKSMPDDELLQAAENGQLQTSAGIREQAERLLADPRAAATIEDFHVQLLGVDGLRDVSRDPARFPGLDTTIRSAMEAEVRHFVRHVVFEDDASWETLLVAEYTFVDADLAAYYDIAGTFTDAMQRVELPTGHPRGGLLKLGALHATHGKYASTSPVLRGKFVRERLLCDTPPPPPDNVDFEPPEIDPDAPARERYEQHSEDPGCAGCHQLMDPIGFAFEHYDAAGAWRALEGDAPIDDRGELIGTEDIDGMFEGVDELAQRLADSEQVRRCLATQWFRYAQAREETAEDACSLDHVAEAFIADGDIEALLLALVQTDAFRHVRPKEEP